MPTGFGIPSPALAATPLPEGYDNDAMRVRAFILNCRDAVKANDIKRRAMLRAAVEDVLRESLLASVPKVAELMMCAVPDSEIEEDEPDPLDFNLPGPETD